MSHKPYLYLCENCKYKGVYPEGNKDNFEDWFCYKTKLMSSYVPCIRIKHCEISNSEKEYIDIDECRDDFYHDVLRILSGDGNNYRANQIIDIFDSLPTVKINKCEDCKYRKD